MSAFLPGLFCIFSILLNQVEAGCTWSVWSSCSVTCGKGIRSRSGTGSDCTQSPTETCSTPTSCYATHLANLNVTVTQHPENKQRPSRPKTLMIDGMPITANGQSLYLDSSCASTDRGDNPWVRLDLKKGYLVSVVRVIIFGSSGQNVAVRVGNSLTNNGNNNHQCGNFPYVYTERAKAIWRNVSCSPPVWGRYISFDRAVTNHFLEICEVSFRYDAILHIRIESKGTCTQVDGHSISVYQSDGLANSIDCSIEPDSSIFTVPLTWKHNGNDVQTSSSQQSFGIYQVNESGIQRLYIINTTNSDAGTYSCEPSVSDVGRVSKLFTLQFNDTWLWELSPCNGSCGVGSRHRNVATFEQHGGKKCTESMQQKCDTNRPPCVSSLDEYLSVDEGEVLNVSCQATQFSALSDAIRFEWFKVKDLEQSNVPVVIDGRVTNSTQNDGQGNFTGKLTFATVSRNDIGLYKCKAFNVHGRSNLSSSISLNVTYGPESVAIHPTHPFVIKGADIVLNCSADGNPTPSYEWQLPQDQTRAGQTLQLSNIKFEEGGTYTCIATNSIGDGVKTSNISVTLQVEGPPQKCSKPSVSSNEGSTVSVNVNCENDGNSPITEYEIQYNTTPSGDWKSVKFMSSSDGPFLLEDLIPLTYYVIRVRAANKYMYEEGDVSFSDLMSVQIAQPGPSPPQNVTVTALTSSSLYVQWNPPSQPNGALQFYKVYYRPSSSNGDFSVSKNIPIDENSFDITELLPYTTHDIYVTVTNDAKTNPESQPSQTVQGRTHTAPPIVPEVPISANNNGQFTSPHISNSNGPILLICVIVYHEPLDVCSPSNTDIPKNIGAYSESSNWYVAAKYTYQEYESNIAGKSFVIGDGQTTTVNGEEYTNVEVTPGYRYSIYILITSAGDSEDYNVSTAPIQYAVALSAQSSSDSDVIIAAIVPTVILLIVIIVLVGIIIKLTRRIHKLDDSVSTCNPVKMETTYMHGSSAYGLTVVQSAKSTEETYEEITSSAQKDNEPTYSSVMN